MNRIIIICFCLDGKPGPGDKEAEEVTRRPGGPLRNGR